MDWGADHELPFQVMAVPGPVGPPVPEVPVSPTAIQKLAVGHETE